MAQDKFTLPIVQGESLHLRFQWKINDVVQPLAAYTAHSQIRAKEDPTSKLLLDLGPYLRVTEDDAIELVIPGSVTQTLFYSDFKRGLAAWDLFLVEVADPTQRLLLLQGAVAFDPAATVVA